MLRKLVLTLIAAAAPAALSRTLTIDDILSLRRLQAVQISPDGSHVAYLVEEPNDELHSKDPILSTLWVAGAAQPASRLIAKGLIRTPQWAPDSRSIGYLSDDQIHVASLPGGEPRAITHHKTAISSFTWAPDGRRAAFVATYVEPKPPALQHQIDLGYDGLDLDVSDTVITRSPGRVWIADVNTGRSEMVKTGSRHIMGARWSPEGSTLLLTTAFRPINDEEQLRPRLETVSIAGGEPRLYCATLGKINTPEWSPDGKSIAFLGSILADSAFYPEALFVCRGSGSTPQNLNPESDYSIDAFRWLGSGDGILISVIQGAYRHLARLSPADPRPVRITSPESPVQTRSDFSSSNGGASQAFVAARYDRPPDVWVLDRKNGAHQITHLNPQLEGLEYGKGEEVHWKARDGWDISGVLILPAGYKSGTRYPMVVHLHGSNSAELNDYQVTSTNWGQFYGAQGYAALIPNYRGSVTGGPKFSRASKHDWGGKDMTDVLDGVDAMVRKGIADPAHLGISGISYGGYLTARTITQDTRFKTATLVSGISNWIGIHTGQTAAPESAQKMEWIDNPYDITQLLWDRSPSAHLKDVKSATIIFWGEFDPAIPVTQAIELYRGLRHFGVPSKLIVYPRDGHVPRERNHMKDLYTRVNAWLRQYL